MIPMISKGKKLTEDYRQKIRETLADSGFQKYFRNTGWMFIARIISLAISFFVTAYIARYLGPKDYGYLSYAVSFTGIFSFIATLGIDQVIYRDLIKFPERKDEYIGSAIFLKLIASLVATVFVIFFSLLSSQKDISSLLIIILSFTFIFNIFNIFIYEFQARVESKFVSLTSIYTTIILNTLKILVVFLNKGIIYLAIILLLEPIITAAFLIFYRTKIIGTLKKIKIRKELMVSLFKDSAPLMLSSAFALVYGRIDQIFIKNLIDTQSVGLYDASVRLSEVWYLVPNILVGSLFPAIVNAKSISDKEYSKRIGKLALLLTVIAVLISIPTTFFAKYIIQIVFGIGFIGGTTVLQIYIWSNIGTFLANLSTNYLINENLRVAIFVSSFIGMAANVILNIVLIPHFGINGSAFATLVSYSLIPISILIFKEPRKLLRDMLS